MEEIEKIAEETAERVNDFVEGLKFMLVFLKEQVHQVNEVIGINEEIKNEFLVEASTLWAELKQANQDMNKYFEALEKLNNEKQSIKESENET